jgi:hypothetical protein
MADPSGLGTKDRRFRMIRKIALIGAATLFSVSLAAAQSSAPSSTAGGAQGTSKSGQAEKAAPKTKGTTGVGVKSNSSPESTAGGAAGTSKTGKER